MNIILLGAPGSGKGTQAPGLMERFGLISISTGDIFRKELKEGSELGLKAKGFMDKGELVPDSLVIEIVLNRLGQNDVKDGFILDGFPRTNEQAERLDEYLESNGRKIDVALCLDIDPEVVVKRLAGRRVCRGCGATYNIDNIPSKREGICDSCNGELYQRDDDKEATVRNRLDVYEKQTASLLKYYADKGVIAHVDGGLPRAESLKLMIKAVEEACK